MYLTVTNSRVVSNGQSIDSKENDEVLATNGNQSSTIGTTACVDVEHQCPTTLNHNDEMYRVERWTDPRSGLAVV